MNEKLTTTENVGAIPKNSERINDLESFEEVKDKLLQDVEHKKELFLKEDSKFDSINVSIGLTKEEFDQEKNNLDIDNQISIINKNALELADETIQKISSVEAKKFSDQYHHPEYRPGIAKQIIVARSNGTDGQEILNDYKSKTQKEKQSFESQLRERSISELMKEKDIVFIHAIPLMQHETRGSNFNNRVFENTKNNVGMDDTYNIIAGLEPTLSVSIPSPDRINNGLFKRHGVILGEGTILSAKNEDSGSEAFSLYKRIPKYGNSEHRNSAIQPKIDIGSAIKTGENTHSKLWNELTVEKPKIAGLFQDLSIDEKYYDINNETWKATFGEIPENEMLNKIKNIKNQEIEKLNSELFEMKNYAEKVNMPLYVFKNESGELKKYKVIFSEAEHTKEYNEMIEMGLTDEMIPDENKKLTYSYNLIPMNSKEIYDNKHDITNQEKNKMIEDIKQKEIIKNL